MKFYILLLLWIVLPISFSDAFELPQVSGANGLRKWDLQQGAVALTLNSQVTSDLSMSAVEAEIRSAIQVWQKAGNPVQLVYGGSANAPEDYTDGVNSILWVNDWQFSSSTLAITRCTYVIEDHAYMVDADILFNDKHFKWGTGLAANDSKADFQQVLLHEIGHLLGLSHTAMTTAALHPYLPENVKHTLNKDDKRGVKYIYDPPSSSLSLVSPVKGAIYPNDLASSGLPLPVVRWYGPAGSSFVVEFSGTKEFKNKVTFAAGTQRFYALNSGDVKKIVALAQLSKVYWRVISGSTATAPRCLKLTQA